MIISVYFRWFHVLIWLIAGDEGATIVIMLVGDFRYGQY